MNNQLSVQQSMAPQSGIITTATSRQAQEIQAAIVIAKNFPRDETAARFKIEQACKRQGLAEVAIYEYPKGNTKVEGPSIRLAETIAQNWGNIDFGIVELDQTDKDSSIMVYAWDLESNTRQMKTFTVPHTRDTREGSYKLTSARDIYEVTANMGARRLRACILGVIPNDVVEDAMATCNKTLTGGSKDGAVDPKRVASMVEKFKKIGVSEEMIVGRIGHNLSSLTASELVKIAKVYGSISDGMGGVDDFFKPKHKKADPDELAKDQARVAMASARDVGVPEELLDDEMDVQEIYAMIKSHKDDLDVEKAKQTAEAGQQPQEAPKETAKTKATKKETVIATLTTLASKMGKGQLSEQVTLYIGDMSAVERSGYGKLIGEELAPTTNFSEWHIEKLQKLYVAIQAEQNNAASNTDKKQDTLSFA